VSASLYRSQLEQKRRQRLDAEKKAGELRSKESKKRAEAATARAAATKTKSATTAKSRLSEAERREKEAATAGKDAGNWQTKASRYAKEEAALMEKVAKAEAAEAASAERRRKVDQQAADRQAAAARRDVDRRLADTDHKLERTAQEVREPQKEKLRILILGASSEGDLRVGREQKRIRAAVESAHHRDLVELDARPAATAQDLLDGITKFRPHVVHFSGHSDPTVIVLEKELDHLHEGAEVSARAFRAAVRATDTPPLLVLLNSCNSAAQIGDLVTDDTPFTIGMTDTIEDGDAITYATQFYASVANGQSIRSAHLAGQAALELSGLEDTDLPQLAVAPGFDPSTAMLVRPQ
jgi:hypothetical protein